MSYPPLTPPVDETQPPPMHEMEWQRFERLTIDLFGFEDGISTSDEYGLSGQADHGVDVIARRRAGDGEEVASCKKTERVSAAKLEEWSQDFLDHWDDHWSSRSIRRFVLATTAVNTGDRAVQDQVSLECARFAEHGIDYELWGRNQFVQKLRRHKAITSQYLGKVWAEIICGPSNDFGVQSSPGAILTAAMVSQMADLHGAISGQIGLRAERALGDLRAGRTGVVSDLIEEFRTPVIWTTLEPRVQAKIIRLAASIAIRTGALEEAERLNGEAEALDPAEEPRIASQLALERDGVAAAIAVLGKPVSISGKQTLAALFIMAGHAEKAAPIVADLMAADPGDAETVRLSSLCKLAAGERKGALEEVRRAEALAGDWTSVLLAGIIIRYAHALSPAVSREWLFFPNPIDTALVRYDDAVQPLLVEALLLIERLAAVDAPHSHAALWRLGVLANMRDRTAETARYAASLLAENSCEPTVISWCLTRRLDVDLSPSLEDLKRQYEERPTLYGTRVLGLALASRDEVDAAAYLWDNLPPAGEAREEAELWIGRIEGTIEGTDADERIAPLLYHAQQNGDWSPVVPHFLEALETAPPHPRALMIAQAAADSGQWQLLDGKVDRLLEFETASAVRIAAFAASRTQDPPRTLAIIEEHADLFGEALPADLRRLRADMAMRAGDVLTALREADRVTSDTGHADDQLFRAEMMARIGNLRASVPSVRQALQSGTMDPNYALHWAQLLAHEEPELSAQLWREAVATGFDDRNVMAAMDQAFQLGLDDEAATLMPLISERAASGDPSVKMVGIDEVREMMIQSRRAANETETLYLQGLIPAHIYARGNSAAFLALYLGSGDSGDGRMLLRMTRHGARPADVQVGISWRDWVIHLDVSGLFEAFRLEMLDLIERHPNGIRISPHLPELLMNMERRSRSIQRSRADALRTAADRISSKTIAILRKAPVGALSVGFDENDGEELEIHKLAAGLCARALVSEAELREKYLVPSHQRAIEPFDLKSVTALHVDQSVVERLAGSDLLDRVLANFSVSMPLRDAELIRLESLAAEEQERLAGVVGGLRQRVADGLQNGSYTFIRAAPAADPDDEEDDAEDEAGEDLLQRQLRDLLKPEPVEGGVVWIEDRLVTGYPRAEAMPVIGMLDVLHELEREGIISRPDLLTKVRALRGSGAAFIPFEVDEVVTPLLEAAVCEEELVETEPLQILRRNFAAVGRIERFIKMGDNIPNSEGRPDEIEFPRSQMRLLSEALQDIWMREDGTLEERAARSDWLWANLRVTKVNRILPGDDASGQDRFEVMQICHVLDKAIDVGGLKDDREDMRLAYLQWVWDRVLRKKVGVDPTFLPRIGDYLADFYSILLRENFTNASKADQKIYLRLMLMRVQALPEPVQRAVLKTGKLDFSGQLATTITVAGTSFDPIEFWQAARTAKLSGSARLQTRSGKNVQMTMDGSAIAFSGGLKANLEDDILDVLVGKSGKSNVAIGRFLGRLDLAPAELATVKAKLRGAHAPHEIAELLADARKESPVNRYQQIRMTLQNSTSFEAELVFPPPFARLASFLGLPKGRFVPGDIAGPFDCLRGGNPDGSVLQRLWGIPVSMPQALFAGMDMSDIEAAAEAARTPIAVTHVAAELRRREPASPILAPLIGRLIALVDRYGSLFLSILRWVDKAIYRDRAWRIADAATRLALIWAHADRVFGEFVLAEAAPEKLVEYFDASQPPLGVDDLLDGRGAASDLSSPDFLNRPALLYHCLGEIFGSDPVGGLLDQADQAKVDALITLKIGDVVMPDMTLVMRGSSPNVMGSFLDKHPHGFFDEPATPDAARAHMIDAALEAIDADPENSLPNWPQLLTFAAGGMSDAQFERYVMLFPTVDIWDLAFAHDEPVPMRWRAILGPMLRHDREIVETSLVDLAAQSRQYFGVRRPNGTDDNPGSSTTALNELIECTALFAGSAPAGQELQSFCQLLERIVSAWPEAAQTLRNVADNLLALTPSGRAAPLWNLHLLLRSFP